jgi:septum formation protein
MAFDTTTEVWFALLSDEEIEYYVDTFHPMDKAGAYGIQEWIGTVAVSRIEGDFYNVMGMPMQAIYQHLNVFIDQQ